jgi:tetratricopeptide (TPR) repeat protein
LDIQKQHAAALQHARQALALPSCEQSFKIYSEIGHPEGDAYALHVLGFIHHKLGNHPQAIRCYQQSIVINRELGSRYWEAVVLDSLGDAYHALGDSHHAQSAWQQAFDILDTLRHPDAKAMRTKVTRGKHKRHHMRENGGQPS